LLLAEAMNFPAIILMLTALSGGVASYPQIEKNISSASVSVAEVQRKAVEYARLDPGDISDWKKKARLSALLPKLQLEYNRRYQNDINVNVSDSVYVGSSGTAVGPNQGEYASKYNNDNNFGVKAIWSLNEAVFNPELLAVSAEARLLARERQAMLSEVNKNYYEREKVAGEIDFLKKEMRRDPDPQKIKQEIYMKQIAIKEADAALDALTGGWFSEEILKRGG